jgi:hypothetical protein
MQRVAYPLLSAAALLLLAGQFATANRDVTSAPADLLTPATADADPAYTRMLTSASSDADSAFDDNTLTSAAPVSTAFRGILQAQIAAATEEGPVTPQQFIFFWQSVQLTITLADRTCATAPVGLNKVLSDALLADVRSRIGINRPLQLRGNVQPCKDVAVSPAAAAAAAAAGEAAAAAAVEEKAAAAAAAAARPFCC